MALTTIALILMSFLSADSSYTTIVWRLVILACGLALTMAPATESIMGSLPLAKAGVGSAVNDTTRQVGGALGVAVLGSVFTSIYGSRVADRLSGQDVPGRGPRPGARTPSAPRCGWPRPSAAASASSSPSAARAAFMDGFRAASRVGAVVTLIGVVITLLWLPARARQRDVTLQAGEFAAERATAGAERRRTSERSEPHAAVTSALAVERPFGPAPQPRGGPGDPPRRGRALRRRRASKAPRSKLSRRGPGSARQRSTGGTRTGSGLVVAAATEVCSGLADDADTGSVQGGPPARHQRDAAHARGRRSPGPCSCQIAAAAVEGAGAA